MLSRTLRRSLLDTRWAQLPPTFLLPFRAHLTTVSHDVEPNNVPDALLDPGAHASPDKATTPWIPAATQSTQPPSSSTPELPPPTSHSPSTPTTPLSDSVRTLLPLLRAQKPHYITAHIHGLPYLLTAGDTLRLPFLMHGVRPGDVLRLNRASSLGSRDYTLVAPRAAKAAPGEGSGGARTDVPCLDERLFVCRAVVMGVESEPMRVLEKTKRRQRRVKKVKSKHRYTVLKITEVEVRGLEEVEAEAEGV